MKENAFEGLIEGVRDAPVPECPGSLESNVLRRIRTATEVAGSSLFDWVAGLLPRPGLVVAALALTVVVSSATTILSIRSFKAAPASELQASDALGFDVFQNTDFLNLGHR